MLTEVFFVMLAYDRSILRLVLLAFYSSVPGDSV